MVFTRSQFNPSSLNISKENNTIRLVEGWCLFVGKVPNAEVQNIYFTSGENMMKDFNTS